MGFVSLDKVVTVESSRAATVGKKLKNWPIGHFLIQAFEVFYFKSNTWK